MDMVVVVSLVQLFKKLQFCTSGLNVILLTGVM